jgi:hypothetical protein
VTTPTKSTILYRIVSYKELPLRLQGSFTYPEAYRLVCEWNQKRAVTAMAWCVKADKP